MNICRQLIAALFVSLAHTISATPHYVDVNSANPTPPFLGWSTAANNIQDAVDVALTGDEVVVTNGVYANGGRVAGTNLLSNRVAVDKPLILRSVNGPAFTTIRGYQVPSTTNGDSAIRCVYLTNGASLFGFTLTNGATRSAVANSSGDQRGGGVWCNSASAMVSNCVMTGNSAYDAGGGAAGGGAWTAGGTLVNCNLTANSATYAGGVYNSILSNCTLTGNSAKEDGGGAWASKLNNCIMTGNSASYGGGAAIGTLNNCVVSSNSASLQGGGLYYGTLDNCRLIGNSANQAGGATLASLVNCTVVGNKAVQYYGGVFSSYPTNCIIYYNTAKNDGTANFDAMSYYCCTLPMPSGLGNITNATLFVDLAGGNLRLQSNSPCINAGNNRAVTNSTDLDGNSRIVGGTVDMGAYECQSPALLDYYTWLQGFGLPTSASAVYADSDGDQMNNWQEWRADTNPTNGLSVLRIVNATKGPNGAEVTWQSVATRNYWLERATNLGEAVPFQTVATNIAGLAGTKTYMDTTATNGGPFFYRVGVQP